MVQFDQTGKSDLGMPNRQSEWQVEPDPTIRFNVQTYPSYFGGEARVMEARPLDIQAGDETSVYYSHGAGWAQEQPTVKQIARFGRSAFAMDFVGDRQPDAHFVIGHAAVGDIPSLHNITAKEVRTHLGRIGMIVPQQQMREAATLLAVIAERSGNYPKIDSVDAIFQSESAGPGLIAAYAQPEVFRRIVLAFPGSLSGPQTGFIPGRIARDALARRPYRPMPDDDFRPVNGLPPHKALRMQLKSPGFKEAAAGLRYSALAPMLHSIRQRDRAPSITLIAGLNGLCRTSPLC